MARLLNGFLGDAVGKIGNIVLRRWRDTYTVSQYQPHVRNPKTAPQIAVRNRLKAVAAVLKPWQDALIKQFDIPARNRISGWADAIKRNFFLCVNALTFDIFAADPLQFTEKNIKQNAASFDCIWDVLAYGSPDAYKSYFPVPAKIGNISYGLNLAMFAGIAQFTNEPNVWGAQSYVPFGPISYCYITTFYNGDDYEEYDVYLNAGGFNGIYIYLNSARIS